MHDQKRELWAKPMVTFLGHPKMLVLCNFLKILIVLDKTIHKAFRKQNQLEIFFLIFTIYQKLYIGFNMKRLVWIINMPFFNWNKINLEVWGTLVAQWIRSRHSTKWSQVQICTQQSVPLGKALNPHCFVPWDTFWKFSTISFKNTPNILIKQMSKLHFLVCQYLHKMW